MKNLSQAFSDLFQDHALHTLYANMRADFGTVRMHDFDVPCTVVSRVQPNCYTTSPHAMIVDYGRDELAKLPLYQRFAATALLAALSGVLRISQVEKFAVINNYGLSTNSFSRAFESIDLNDLTAQCLLRFPSHCLAIRSLNAVQNGDLMHRLAQAGWQMVVTRQVYLAHDWAAAFKRFDSKKDQKLLRDGKYHFEKLSASSPESDFQAAVQWYNLLYLQKYSRQNVQFTATFFRQAVARDILHLYLLRDSQTQQAVGTAGMVMDSSYATSPVVGYDTALPAKLGLYRRCMVKTMEICQENGLPLNFSSGAPDFKKLRGAKPEMEYMAVYTAHLPKWRRGVWHVLRWLSIHYYAKMLQKYGL